MSDRLSDIYSTYPKTSFDCDCAAQETLGAFRNAGIDGQVVEFQDKFGADILMDREGNRIAESGFHQTVRVGDRFYDALTGAEGATQDEYFDLFYGDAEEYLREVPARPFNPRQQ